MSHSNKIDKCRYLLIGGAGYVAQYLCSMLCGLPTTQSILLFDIQRIPVDPKWDKVHTVVGSLQSLESIREAMKGINIVIYIPSSCTGMNGISQSQQKLVWDMNYGCTNRVVSACNESGVRSLVYVSSSSAVFYGQELVNADESLPYPPLTRFVDPHSKSKCAAEQAVLAASGHRTAEAVLRTCAIRPGYVYGEGEEHLQRAVRGIKRGLFRYTVGEVSTLCDFVHVENLCHAIILAASDLHSGSESNAAGHVYFVSDEKPVNYFRFFAPLLELYGYSYPRLAIPTVVMFYLAWMCEVISAFFCLFCPHFLLFRPWLTRAEVNRIGVTHHFKTERARKDLNYKAVVTHEEGIRRVLCHYQRLDFPDGNASEHSKT